MHVCREINPKGKTDLKKDKTLSAQETEKQFEFMDKVRKYNREGMRAYIETFGCQQNEADSERLAGMAEYMGYTVTDDPSDADLIVVNTCAVREHAELKALSVTGQFKHIKQNKSGLIIAMCGCMVSQEHRSQSIKNSYPYVDFVFDTRSLHTFPERLYERLVTGKRSFDISGSQEGVIAEGLPVRRASDFKAWLSVMYGCNNFCTYCIVPYVRGRERSRRRENILEEARQLAASGYREITLLGQNVNSYGNDLYDDYDFADLLADICRTDGDFTVRFMTSHPKDATRKLIDTMAENAKIAKQFHLPLQSGSDRILGLMNRKYNRDRYLDLVGYMRLKIPDITITTDIIVGFPGETEEDFEMTLDMLSRVQYDNIFSFIYSKRKGTPAEKMSSQVPDDVKKERFERLIELQNGISRRKNEEYIGKTIRVLVEGRSKTDDSKLTGRNEKNRLVHFEGGDSLIGGYADVTVESVQPHALFGRLV